MTADVYRALVRRRQQAERPLSRDILTPTGRTVGVLLPATAAERVEAVLQMFARASARGDLLMDEERRVRHSLLLDRAGWARQGEVFAARRSDDPDTARRRRRAASLLWG